MGRLLCATRGGEGSRVTQDRAVALAKEQGDALTFLFVVDLAFLSQLAAPMVVDIESRLEKMGRFELTMAQERAAAQGLEVETMIRCGRLREELGEAACEIGATLILLGRPLAKTGVFEDDTLQAFAACVNSDTDVEVRII